MSNYKKLPLVGGTTATIDNDYRIVANAAARNALTQSDGLRVWQTDTMEFYISDGASWNLRNSAGGSFNETIFISPTGDDTTGTGSISQPYKTLRKAVTEANAVASAVNPIAIQVEPGVYVEDNSVSTIDITEPGISIVGASPNACIITCNTPANNLLTCDDDVYFQGVLFSGVSSATAVTFSGTLKVQRMVEVTFSNCQVAVASTNTGTVILEACVFQLYTTGIDADAGEFICGDVAFLGSLNPVSPAGTGVDLASGAKFLADTVRMANSATGVITAGTSILYNHDFLICDTAINMLSGAVNQCIGSTFRDLTTSNIVNAAGTLYISSSNFTQSTTTQSVGVSSVGSVVSNITGCVFDNLATGVLANSSSDVTISSSTFSNCTTDLSQADASSVVRSFSNVYDSTKLSITDTTNFIENSFLTDLSRQRLTGDQELDGSIIGIEQTTDPAAEADKTKLYFKNTGGNDVNTLLLLPFNGGNGSTTFTDTSASARTVTPINGTAQTSTPVKFGVSSCEFDSASTQYLTVPDSNDFDWDSDYTVDCWVQPNSGSGAKVFFEHRTDGSNLIQMRVNGNETVRWRIEIAGAVTDLVSTSIGLNSWTHLAFERSGDDYTLYVNGISTATTTLATTVPNFTEDLTIGAQDGGGGNSFQGFIDEFRISNVARYQGNFTPPQSAYGVSGAFLRTEDGSVSQIQTDIPNFVQLWNLESDGTVSTGSNVDIGGELEYSGVPTASTGTTLIIDGGNIVRPLTSSRKTKENIKDLPESSWIYDVKWKQYNYIGTNPEEDVSFGCIAEELAEINQDLVVYKDGEPFSIQYDEFVPFIVTEMKKIKDNKVTERVEIKTEYKTPAWVFLSLVFLFLSQIAMGFLLI